MLCINIKCKLLMCLIFLVRENLVELHNRNLAQLHLRLENVHYFFLGNKSHISCLDFHLILV